MSETESALLREIIANRDDDTPRLVCADYLEENGQAERAEFIRLQIELAKMPKTVEGKVECHECVGSGWYLRDPLAEMRCDRCGGSGMIQAYIPNPAREPLLKRERELFSSIKIVPIWRWSLSVAITIDQYVEKDSYSHLLFRRGFVEVVQCSWADWLTHHAAIMQGTPLRQVRITQAHTQGLTKEHCAVAWPTLEFELPRADHATEISGWFDPDACRTCGVTLENGFREHCDSCLRMRVLAARSQHPAI